MLDAIIASPIPLILASLTALASGTYAAHASVTGKQD